MTKVSREDTSHDQNCTDDNGSEHVGVVHIDTFLFVVGRDTYDYESADTSSQESTPKVRRRFACKDVLKYPQPACQKQKRAYRET